MNLDPSAKDNVTNLKLLLRTANSKQLRNAVMGADQGKQTIYLSPHTTLHPHTTNSHVTVLLGTYGDSRLFLQ